jgi:hypothetical protein
MLAKFIDIEGRERWVNVEIKDNIEVKEGPRRVVFIHEIKGVTVEETANPSKMPDELSIIKIELDAKLKKKKKVYLPAFVREMSRILDRDELYTTDLINVLRDVTSEYIIRENYIYRV